MSDALSVGKQLVALCREGKNYDAVKQLYAKDVVSIEAHGDESMPARTQGLDAILKKHDWWYANNTTHGGTVEGPFPHGDRFIVYYTMDITPKMGPMEGKRMMFKEAGLYTVKDGKIAHEEWFYDMSC